MELTSDEYGNVGFCFPYSLIYPFQLENSATIKKIAIAMRYIAISQPPSKGGGWCCGGRGWGWVEILNFQKCVFFGEYGNMGIWS